jgi:hypothetical protein
MRAQPERKAMGQASAVSMLDSRAVRLLVAALFLLHGLVHMMGFAAVWGLGDVSNVASVPTVPAGLTAGSPLVLALGVLWLVAMAAFLAAAAGLVLHAAWWKEVAAGAAALSLLLCVAWWNDAIVGVIINAVILASLAIQAWATRGRQPKGSLT